MAHVMAASELVTATIKRPSRTTTTTAATATATPTEAQGAAPGGRPGGALAAARHEFGEHSGVNMSIEASATFTVMEPDTMGRLFAGELGLERGDLYIYSRHFNPMVLALGR